jgi:magnesium chelatase family protein
LLCGELGLDGAIRSIRGGLAIAELGNRLGAREVLIPAANAAEAAALGTVTVNGVKGLNEAVQHLVGTSQRGPTTATPARSSLTNAYEPDLSEVRGQETAKWALEVAAAGGHNLLLIGPPASGKTMLARRLPGLLPPLSREEAITVSKLHSLVAEEPLAGLLQQRPVSKPTLRHQRRGDDR